MDGDHRGLAEPVGAGYSGGITGGSFRPDSQDLLAPSGQQARLNANLAALRTLRLVQAGARPATASEQAVLARWGGWGALPQVFDDQRGEYAAARAELRQLLPGREYEAATRTVLNAHYTDPAVVKEVWSAVQGLGFRGGLVLEPGCGSGTFIGLAPDGVHATGVELDPTTAAIAQLLYPAAEVRSESFADSHFPEGRFDLAVGNVPFAQVAQGPSR